MSNSGTNNPITDNPATESSASQQLNPGAALAGVRVLDLTRNFAGPYCTMILGDLGADVVKVERPQGGDDTRRWKPPAWNGESATFLAANRNKRSLAVDLNTPEGVAIVKQLARTADVLVESFRPGSLTKRGLGYEALREENERLIYCSISAYGPTGPQANSPGYDPILQAATGQMELTGAPEGPIARL
ncbi:MAG: CoA transferase, partial [Caldilineae bacterium]